MLFWAVGLDWQGMNATAIRKGRIRYNFMSMLPAA